MLYAVDHVSALAIFGNEFLRGHGKSIPPSSTFDFDQTLRFNVSGDTDAVKLICADTPFIWLSMLNENGVTGLRVRYAQESRDRFPHRELSVLLGPGRGRWFIETVGATETEYWESKWSFADTWHAKYSLVKIDQATLGTPPDDLAAIAIELENALVEIAAYADRNGLRHFVPLFSHAIENLHSDKPPTRIVYTHFNADLAGSHVLNLAGKRLIGAARSAWGVFGTMGAWNDRPKDECTQQYLDLTERLGFALTRAMLAATNSTCQPAAKTGFGQTLL